MGRRWKGGWSLLRQILLQQSPREGKRNNEGKERKSKEGVSSALFKGATH